MRIGVIGLGYVGLPLAVAFGMVAAALVSSWLITVSEIATQVVDLLKPALGV